MTKRDSWYTITDGTLIRRHLQCNLGNSVCCLSRQYIRTRPPRGLYPVGRMKLPSGIVRRVIEPVWSVSVEQKTNYLEPKGFLSEYKDEVCGDYNKDGGDGRFPSPFGWEEF